MLSRNRLGPSVMVIFLRGYGVAPEPAEPVAREQEFACVEPIDPRPPLPLMAEDPRRLEQLQVAGRGRPGMAEQPGDLARAHRAAGEIEADQDPPPRRMR